MFCIHWQSIRLSVTKMEVGRHVVGGLSLKLKKKELVVRDALKLG